jgi:hypothetical protein
MQRKKYKSQEKITNIRTLTGRGTLDQLISWRANKLLNNLVNKLSNHHPRLNLRETMEEEATQFHNRN